MQLFALYDLVLSLLLFLHFDISLVVIFYQNPIYEFNHVYVERRQYFTSLTILAFHLHFNS